MTAEPMQTSTGRSSNTITIATAPGTRSPYRLVCPGLDLHRGTGRQRGDTDGAARRPVVPEAIDVGIVERRERVHVGQEAQRLGHVGQRCTDAGQLRLEVLDRLRGLCGDTA